MGEELRFTSAPPATITTYDSGLTIHTAKALGGLGDIAYIRVSANPPALAANFNVGSDNGEIRIQQPLTTATTLSLYIQAAGQIGDRLATLLLTVAAVDPPDFAAVLDDASPVVITGYNGLVAQVNSAGGGGGHTYTFQSGGGNFAVGADGRISLLISRPTPTTLTGDINGG